MCDVFVGFINTHEAWHCATSRSTAFQTSSASVTHGNDLQLMMFVEFELKSQPACCKLSQVPTLSPPQHPLRSSYTLDLHAGQAYPSTTPALVRKSLGRCRPHQIVLEISASFPAALDSGFPVSAGLRARIRISPRPSFSSGDYSTVFTPGSSDRSCSGDGLLST